MSLLDWFTNANQGEPDHDRFMKLALGLAERGLMAGELPIGAILVLKGDVIAEACCSDKRRSMLAHPELLALSIADRKHPSLQERRQTTLYTNLEPCLMCLGAAMSFCAGQIVYGADAPADGAVTRLSQMSFEDATYPEYTMPAVVGGVLRDESRALFRAFIGKSTDRTLISFANGVLASASDDRNASPLFPRRSDP
jgi:tRNA(adenine34) deaminase